MLNVETDNKTITLEKVHQQNFHINNKSEDTETRKLTLEQDSIIEFS